ncbi:RagB/SusD family nutrient uptake outer membrane protein [Aquimarina sp. ERC-38]|uniref:RagB/SusD family nutrient uptake outer membrane protein n=1 Tax=Aquimarina sp. ERC-38 TaxID=2949996 RepID=UPI00224826EA|nr:RagB/SusD family nutrient uptake outer membrane protein [Aquimarina sp. ERC-38]UZO80467.1 RagB/SusD family nutrient uptake outer membrane protein [Aquimarina sp. ERC-38]
MKNIINILFTALFLIFITSCEDELELEPQQSIDGSLALSTEQNISALLIGAYDESGQVATFGGRNQVLADLLGTEDQVSWNGTFLDPRQFLQKTILVDNGFVENSWTNAYEAINQLNLILDNLDVVVSSEDRKNSIEGEARFLRALNYFDLVRLWGLSYVAGSENSQPGVPLRNVGITNFLQDVSAPRASVQAIYDFLINDLIIAYDLLPADNDFFADKYSAQGLLARVYLQQGNYLSARDAANDVIENSGHVLLEEYANAFNNDVDSEETVFAFQVTNQTGGNDLITFYASEDNGGRGGDITINEDYINLFSDADDVRSTFFVENPFGDRLTAKYTNQFGNVEILRLAEMYLIRAESNLVEGTTMGASPLEDINTIRERSNANSLTGAITLQDILNERQLELAFEGFLFHDLQRNNIAIGTIPADSPSLVLPIPQDEMDTNSLIEQNPGYN